jgi:hypothetical protein
VAGQLPSTKCLKRTIQRASKTVEASPANPQSHNFKIPNNFKITLDNEQFLLYDSGDNDMTIESIIFNRKKFDHTKKFDHWFLDRTFSSYPNLYGQLYTIRAVYSGEIVPLVYVLLLDKKEVANNKMFQALKSLKFDLCPKSFTTDFKKAAINSIKNEFPSTEIHGCFFNFSQAVLRKIQNYVLTIKYNKIYRRCKFCITGSKINIARFYIC